MNNKKLLSLMLVIVVAFCCTVTPISAVDENNTTFAVDMTLEEFLALPYSEQIKIVDSMNVYRNNSSNARYKSGENDPTHTDISTAGIAAFINDRGFWSTGTDGLMYSLSIAIYSAAPDNDEDEAHTFANTDHFYVVPDGKGLGGGTSASERFTLYYNKAVNAQKKGDTSTAMTHLGRALHYIQDVTVPHHAKGAATAAHYQYEAFCDENIETYLGGFKSTSDSFYKYSQIYEANQLVPFVANNSVRSYDKVKTVLDKSQWGAVASNLTVYAAQMTSAVLYMYALDCNLKLTKELT